MKTLPALPNLPSGPRQLTIPLDAPKLRGMSRKERNAVLGALAGLMLEAANVPAREDDDAVL